MATLSAATAPRGRRASHRRGRPRRGGPGSRARYRHGPHLDTVKQAAQDIKRQTEALVGQLHRLERMLAGVSTRRYERTGEPVGSEVDEIALTTSKSAVSREFVSRTREHLIELMSRPLGDRRLAVLVLDGIE